MRFRPFKLLLLAMAAYVGYAAVVFVQQRQMMYPGAVARAEPIAAARDASEVEGVRRVDIPATFGHVRALLLPGVAAEPRAPAVLFMHGNYQSIDQLVHAFDRIRALGLHVLLVEYPGYGGAPGSPSFATLREAAAAGYDWLAREPGVDRSRIIAMGGSLGGGPACQLTADRPVRALILLSTFREVGQFARERWLPGLIVLDRFDNVGRVRDFGGPVLVFHGRDDDIIPFTSGADLAAAARDAQLVPLACGHDDCPYTGEAFAHTVAAFLRERGVLPAGVALAHAASGRAGGLPASFDPIPLAGTLR